MSDQCGVICLDCRDEAPSVGDGGFVGAPSLDLEAWPDYKGWGTLQTFGFLYEALAALHITTYELDVFRGWLGRHSGHRVTLYAESDEFSPELLAIFDSWDTLEHKRESVAGMKQREADALAAQAEGRYQMAFYSATCERCSDAIASPEPELLRRFEPTTLSAADVDLYLHRWGPAIRGQQATWRLMSPIIDPGESFVPELRQFLERHREHDISVALSGDAAA